MSNAGFDALMKWVESAVDMDDCERQIMSSGIGDATRPLVGIHRRFHTEYEFPQPTHGVGAALPKATIRDALAGMPLWPTGEFNTDPFHWYYMSRNRRRDWDETAKTIVSRDRHIPLHPISPPLVYRERDKYEFADGRPARRFSYREAAILQGFPPDMQFPECGGLYSRYKVIGNAVPPPLFHAVASALPDIW